jgi:S-adenosylmethionine uptake transporter
MSSNKNLYFIGIGWFLLSIVCSVLNDSISKYTGNDLHSFQVAFFRFLFSTLTLIPFIIHQGINTLKSPRPFVHFMRGVILFFGITAWTYGLNVAPLAAATLISFTIPLFTLILASFFLKENIIWQRWVATILGFIGIALALGITENQFSTSSLIFIVSAIGFASLDIINKKFVIEETMLSMLFYSAIVTTILAFVPALMYWKTPTLNQLVLFLILGASANLILFFILKAFSLIDATAIAPYRYTELLLSSFIGFFIFDESVTKGIFYGALIIIPATLFIVYSENRAKKG